jgi:hypothetical protein
MYKYNRQNAVNYALTYALKPNPYYRYFPLIGNSSGDCSNFISQCLYSGNIPMIYNGNSPWWYTRSSRGRSYDTWSVSWAVANSLYWHIKISSIGYEVFETSDLSIGDLIFFQDIKNVIFHSMIITNFSNSLPLVCQHTFEAKNVPYNKSWDYYKAHFIKIKF